MPATQLKDAMRGVSVTTVTPFSNDLSKVDTEAISRNLSFLDREGVKMVVPCGNTGEFYSLTETEWTEVVKATVDTVSRKMVVMAGVGHSTSTAISMVHRAEELGAEGVMVMYPQHVFVSEEGILNYYREILDANKGIDVVLYKKGPLLSDDVLKKLMTNDRLVGVKYAFGRIVDFARTIQKLGKSIVWSCGTAERFTPFFWLAGAEGFTTGLGNFAPHISLSMFKALRNVDFDETMRYQNLAAPLEFLREERGVANNVPVIKAMLDHVGLVGGSCRPPIHDLNSEEREAVIAATSEWDLKRP
jgi:4-hydroxy-tetrahydrodipicolinate synthase